MEADMGFEENLADSKQRLASMVDIFFFRSWLNGVERRFVWRTRWLARCAWVYVTGKISKNYPSTSSTRFAAPFHFILNMLAATARAALRQK